MENKVNPADMTLDALLQNPGNVKHIPLADIRLLTETYPYSAHLHLLLLVRTILEKGEADEDLLAKTALLLPHQEILRKFIRSLESERIDTSGNKEMNIADIDSLLKPVEEEFTDDQPMHRSSDNPFVAWLLKFTRTKKYRDLEEEAPSYWREKRKVKIESPKDPIQEPVSSDHQIASEALAEILYKQGYHEKAIGMYEKLILINPAKKDTFARKIREIKNN